MIKSYIMNSTGKSGHCSADSGIYFTCNTNLYVSTTVFIMQGNM